MLQIIRSKQFNEKHNDGNFSAEQKLRNFEKKDKYKKKMKRNNYRKISH